jgi:hypothetical protein
MESVDSSWSVPVAAAMSASARLTILGSGSAFKESANRSALNLKQTHRFCYQHPIFYCNGQHSAKV